MADCLNICRIYQGYDPGWNEIWIYCYEGWFLCNSAGLVLFRCFGWLGINWLSFSREDFSFDFAVEAGKFLRISSAV